ncbi:hypothetical protein B7494_g3902 [Chlorociboria aeruginascens]|nr:hypothetical protein B7494_g3902 [Chlorociboria aeruginascens]
MRRNVRKITAFDPMVSCLYLDSYLVRDLAHAKPSALPEPIEKMPPSSKRPQRARREVANKEADVPDSSPSRPAKRRKKAEDVIEKQAPESTELPLDRSGIPMDDVQLTDVLVQFLTMPAHPVQASEDHANSLHEKHSKEGVQAYAKLAGKDWTFYVKRLRNNIGRPPEGTSASAKLLQRDSPNTSDLPDGADEENAIHIDFGPNKTVSRLHAQIYFDADSEQWSILVNGRNGARVDGKPLLRGEHSILKSGEIIEIAGIEMMFVLPHDNLDIHRTYLHRAGLIRIDANQLHDSRPDQASTEPIPASSQARGQNGLPAPLPIAPAPPDYRRPGTPVSSRPKAPYSTGKSPGYTNAATIVINGDDIDLSLDSNRHIKPSYSYSQMITQAILDTRDEKLNLNGIYNFIMEKYAYYRNQAASGWQNSIRHNLSLNKQFHKVARSTDEPGKGMKWCIVPEFREEMAKAAQRSGRGGHRGSSAPSSPANLRASKDMSGNPSSPQKTKRSPRSGSTPLSAYPSKGPEFTPDRGIEASMSTQVHLPGDGSPLPRHRRPHSNPFGVSDHIAGSPPALSSSFLQEDNNPLVTPAPLRVHPHLAPPSTAQRPSQHMPTSSPAPFWKYADLTPLRGAATTEFDMSPLKNLNTVQPITQSSSPPPVRRSPAFSPTRNRSPGRLEVSNIEELEDEDQGLDLSK